MRVFFYPSTIFIEHPEDGFEEYAAAKLLGEAVDKGAKNSHLGFRLFPRDYHAFEPIKQ